MAAPNSGPAAEPLRIAAASDLQKALPALVERFQAVHTTRVVWTFGASGQLADQIAAGAPFDVFLAANEAFVRRLAEQQIIRPASAQSYARGSLVLAVYRDTPIPVEDLTDLARPEVRKIALANPDFAPYGAAGKQALERAGLWDELQPKIVQAETVRQALQFVQTGNAEAGLVGRAIADVPEVRVVTVDPSRYDPIIQGLGVVATTRQPDAAEAFARFVLGPEGQAILARFGFLPPDGQPAPALSPAPKSTGS